MYTKEDFLRDYPPSENKPFPLPPLAEAVLEQTYGPKWRVWLKLVFCTLCNGDQQSPMERSFEQGKLWKSRKVVLAMHAKNFSLDVIADVTGVDAATVQAWIDVAQRSATAVQSATAADKLSEANKA